MPRIDHDLLQLWFDHPEYDAQAAASFRELAVPEALLARCRRALRGMRAVSPRFAADELVDDGASVELAGIAFTVVVTPGHSPGHACLEHSATRTLLAGDHVLPHITPNISREFGLPAAPSAARGPEFGLLDDPLTAYRASLRRVRGRGYRVAYPAHGEPLHGPDIDRRIDEILAHHREREARLVALLDAREPRGLEPLASGLFDLGKLDDWESWLALGETRAHLRALETAGRAVAERIDGALLFRLTVGAEP
jgi:glyoxylase-like metal-dependent hydrolase (beta-lactamase superfamily II)